MTISLVPMKKRCTYIHATVLCLARFPYVCLTVCDLLFTECECLSFTPPPPVQTLKFTWDATAAADDASAAPVATDQPKKWADATKPVKDAAAADDDDVPEISRSYHISYGRSC